MPPYRRLVQRNHSTHVSTATDCKAVQVSSPDIYFSRDVRRTASDPTSLGTMPPIHEENNK